MTHANIDRYLYSGDVIVDDLTLVSHTGFEMSLINLFDELSIYEDLFSPSLSGSLSIGEALMLAENFPVVGHETLRVSFRTPSLAPVEREFRVYKVSPRITGNNELASGYSLHFTTREQEADVVSSVNVALSGTIGSMAESLWSMSGLSSRPISIQPTEGTYKFVIPGWSVFQTLRWLASKAKAKTGLCDFVFWESLSSHNFASISSLYGKPAKREFFYHGKNTRSGSEKSTARDFSSLNSYQIDRTFDTMGLLVDGAFGCHLTAVDVATKSWSQHSANYFNRFDLRSRPNASPIIPASLAGYANPLARRDYMATHVGLHATGESPIDLDQMASRQVDLQQCDAIRLNARAPGDSTFRAGDKAYVDLPRTESPTRDKESDAYLSGDYIASAVRHVVTPNTYTMDLELIRDSLSRYAPDEKPNELGVR